MKMRVKPRINYVEGREMFDRPDGIIDCAGEIDGFMFRPVTMEVRQFHWL